MEPAFDSNREMKLLLRSNRVLGSLGDAELPYRLRLDLDRFAGLRIAAHAGFPVCLHEAAQPRHGEDTVLLGFFDGGVGEMLEKCRRGFVVDLGLFGELPNKLSFR